MDKPSMLIVAPESTFLVFKSSTVPVINPVCCENTGLQINKATIIKRYLSVNFNGFKGEQDSLQIYHFPQYHRIPILLIRIKPNLRRQREPKLRIESQQDIILVQKGNIDKLNENIGALMGLIGDGLRNKASVTIDFKPVISLNNSTSISLDV